MKEIVEVELETEEQWKALETLLSTQRDWSMSRDKSVGASHIIIVSSQIKIELDIQIDLIEEGTVQ